MSTNSIKEKVAQQLSDCGPKITERAIAHFVEKEVARRSEAVIKALSNLEKLEKEGSKIKPDIVAYDDDGKILSSSWSKQKIDERNSNFSKISKLQKSIEKAIENNEFSDLFNLVNSNEKPDAPAD